MYVFFLRRQVVVPDRDKKVVRTHQSPLSPPPILPKNDCCKGGSCFFLVADELAAIAAIDQEEVGTHDGTSTRQKDDKDWIPACAAERPSEYTPRIQEHPRGDGTKGLGGEGDPQGTAETDEMPIHELAPVVRMEGDDLPRIPAETRLQGSDHIDLCFRPDGPRFRPSRAPIRDGQVPVNHTPGVPRQIAVAGACGRCYRDVQQTSSSRVSSSSSYAPSCLHESKH